MLKGDKVELRFLKEEDAEASLKLQTENREFFEEYAMTRNEDFYTIAGQKEWLEQREKRKNADQEFYFGIFSRNKGELIGTISLFQVVRGSMQSAYIGYFCDRNHNGKGYMTEAVGLITEYAFKSLKLHRIEAGVMPHNLGSIRVLEKAGFHKEGIAISNTLIKGVWRDHQVLAIINPAD